VTASETIRLNRSGLGSISCGLSFPRPHQPTFHWSPSEISARAELGLAGPSAACAG